MYIYIYVYIYIDMHIYMYTYSPQQSEERATLLHSQLRPPARGTESQEPSTEGRTLIIPI